MQKQLMQAQKEYSEFLLFCDEVSKMFEVGKCYQMKGKIYRNNGTNPTINLGRFSGCLIFVGNMTMSIVFETLITIQNNNDFNITDTNFVTIKYTAMIEQYQIKEVSEEHFLNMQSRVIALQVTKRQLIKEFLKQN
jgi:hypothetical protein